MEPRGRIATGASERAGGARKRRRSRLATWAVAVAATALLAAATAPGAAAGIEIGSFEVTSSDTQAGGHPDLGMSFTLVDPGQPESARDVVVNTPAGIFGNPNAINQCSSVDFALEQCAPATQAGVITVNANYEGDVNRLLGTAPIFSLQPPGDATAQFAFIVPTLNIPVSIPVAVRTASDYGLRFRVSQLTQLAPLAGAELEFWGFPADPENDPQRFPTGSPGNPAGCPGLADTSCVSTPVPATIPVYPMINNPVHCSGEPLTARISVVTYQDPENPTEGSSSYPPVTDCFDMTFKPVLYANPTTREADSPSGLDLRMSAPQPLGRATTPSPIRSASVTFPPGFTINPDAADGQSSCSDADANFDSEGPAACPDQAKIGTFSIGTPALDGRLNGSIYIGEPKPGDQYRLFLIADGFGIRAKLLGSFRPDPATGRLVASIDDLPQVPFDDFELHLFASDRGLMATPERCGVYDVEAHFFPWNDALADQRSVQIFSIDSGPGGSACPGPVRPFNPRLAAGTTDPTAGGFTNFALQLDRDDGDQYLGDLGFRMPPGFTGSLRGISYCPEAALLTAAQNPGRVEQLRPSCPPSSRIGTTNVAAGPGGHPFNVVGAIYLTGPFKGAPLSLAAITPAVAGPYDYGTQVVRVAVNVDPLDARVVAISDTVPQIIGGVPLRLRRIRVNLDRPNFVINPTNCRPTTIRSEGIGDQGTAAAADSYFRVVNCFSLGLRPRMTIRQLGRRATARRSRNPRLRFDLRTRPGDANVKSVSVTLPKAFAIDQRHLGNICSRAQLAAERCAGRQPIGHAWVRTPLLDEPLAGPAYAVSGFGKLPRVVFILDGQVMIAPQARSSSVKNGHLRTVVPVVPDAPIGHFRLTLLGGGKGYLVNTRDLCASRPVATVRFDGHNGRRLTQRVGVKTPCGKRRQARRSSHGRR